jgi:hypothetical protein
MHASIWIWSGLKWKEKQRLHEDPFCWCQSNRVWWALEPMVQCSNPRIANEVWSYHTYHLEKCFLNFCLLIFLIMAEMRVSQDSPVIPKIWKDPILCIKSVLLKIKWLHFTFDWFMNIQFVSSKWMNTVLRKHKIHFKKHCKESSLLGVQKKHTLRQRPTHIQLTGRSPWVILDCTVREGTLDALTGKASVNPMGEAPQLGWFKSCPELGHLEKSLWSFISNNQSWTSILPKDLSMN